MPRHALVQPRSGIWRQRASKFEFVHSLQEVATTRARSACFVSSLRSRLHRWREERRAFGHDSVRVCRSDGARSRSNIHLNSSERRPRKLQLKWSLFDRLRPRQPACTQEWQDLARQLQLTLHRQIPPVDWSIDPRNLPAAIFKDSKKAPQLYRKLALTSIPFSVSKARSRLLNRTKENPFKWKRTPNMCLSIHETGKRLIWAEHITGRAEPSFFIHLGSTERYDPIVWFFFIAY